MTTTTAVDWAAWLARWHCQQEHYLHDRPRRFSLMLDYVEHLRGTGPLALVDLCCGPGSITAAALGRFPSATVLACDLDPWLVEMGRRTLGADPRVRWLETDLRAEGWADDVGGGHDAILSSTALHWFHRDELVRLFERLASLLVPGGVFLNADHLPVRHGRIATASHDRKQLESARKLATPGAERAPHASQRSSPPGRAGVFHDAAIRSRTPSGARPGGYGAGRYRQRRGPGAPLGVRARSHVAVAPPVACTSTGVGPRSANAVKKPWSCTLTSSVPGGRNGVRSGTRKR
jgi:SAM-dependent methyltransferase